VGKIGRRRSRAGLLYNRLYRYPLTIRRQFDILQFDALAGGERMQFDQLRRREFITLLGGAAAWPLAARAQQQGKLPAIDSEIHSLAPDRFAKFWKDSNFVRAPGGCVGSRITPGALCCRSGHFPNPR
jgi:hypothetical protein